MNWSIVVEKTLRQLPRLFLALGAYAFAHLSGLHDFTSHEVEGLNVLIQLVGDIYAVLLAFAIFVIWGQFTEVENCVIRECDSLADLLRFSAYLNADDRATIRKAMAAYTRQVVQYEWATLGEGQKDERADEYF